LTLRPKGRIFIPMKTVIIIKRYDFTDDEDLSQLNIDTMKPMEIHTKLLEHRDWFQTTFDIVIKLWFARLFKRINEL